MVKAPKGRGVASPAAAGRWDISGVGGRGRGGRGPGRAHQLLQLPLPVAQLLVHALPRARALQGRDDLQLRVVVVDDVVLQHQAQDLPRPGGASLPAGTPGRAALQRLRGPTLACPERRESLARLRRARVGAPCDRRSSSPRPLRDAGASPAPAPPPCHRPAGSTWPTPHARCGWAQGLGEPRDRPGSLPSV